MDRTKTQSDKIPSPDGLSPKIIISPDTRRTQRLPPGQVRSRKWPVLDASGPPAVDLDQWRFRVAGLVGTQVQWDWQEFTALPRV